MVEFNLFVVLAGVFIIIIIWKFVTKMMLI